MEHFNSQPQTLADLEKTANLLRQEVIVALQAAGSGHSAGPLGLADIFATLYFSVLRHRPDEPDWSERDLFVLSNGHCAPIYYATLANCGYFEKSQLASLRQFGSKLQGHPERQKLPGLETTSGPLGSGLSQAIGMALAIRSDSARRVVVVMGDGELNEGNVWEAAMLASKYGLGNLLAIIDRNQIQIDGPTELVMPLEDLAAKWQAFGWHVLEIDGHDIPAIIEACAQAQTTKTPTVIIAKTTPGKGVDFIEGDFHWHGRTPNRQEALEALNQLRTLAGRISSEHQ